MVVSRASAVANGSSLETRMSVDFGPRPSRKNLQRGSNGATVVRSVVEYRGPNSAARLKSTSFSKLALRNTLNELKFLE